VEFQRRKGKARNGLSPVTFLRRGKKRGWFPTRVQKKKKKGERRCGESERECRERCSFARPEEKIPCGPKGGGKNPDAGVMGGEGERNLPFSPSYRREKKGGRSHPPLLEGHGPGKEGRVGNERRSRSGEKRNGQLSFPEKIHPFFHFDGGGGRRALCKKGKW